MAEGTGERRLAAILSADAVGYSRLMAANEAATVQTLSSYRDLIAALVEGQRGRVVDFTGDNALCEFPSAFDAAQSALVIQEAIDRKNAALPVDRVMAFRIGIHLGDVLVEGERIYGDGVNIAARLEALASPGGICISAPVHDQVKNKLAARFEDLGEQNVKNIPDPVHVWRLQRSEAALAATTPAPRQPGRLRWQVPLATVAVLAVLAVLAGAVWLLRPELVTGPPPTRIELGPPAVAPVPARPSVAVLPFANLSGDPEQEYFADGMADDLITDLSRVSGLDTVARSSSFRYRGQDVDVKQIARELGVRYLVQGSVRRSGGEIRINAQLVDAATEHQLWAERFDRELVDVFALQDEVTAQIVRALHVELGEPELRRLARRPTADLAAYEELLRGEHLMVLVSEDRLRRARAHYLRALELDPDLAEARGALARADFLAWIWQWSDELDLDRGLASARRAVELDPDSPAAARTLGVVHLNRKEFDAALRELRRAVELAPRSGIVLGTLGLGLIFADQVREGLEIARRGSELEPRAPFNQNVVGRGNRRLGRREEAIAAYQRALDLLPTGVAALAGLAVLLDEAGRLEESRAAVEKLREVSPRFRGAVYAERLPYRDPLDAERLAQGLARVGLP